MNISCYCRIVNLNWQALTEIKSRLLKFDIVFHSIEIELNFYTTVYEIDSAEQALEFIKKNNAPSHYVITIYSKRKEDNISIRINSLVNLHKQDILKIRITGVENDSELNSIMEFLGLEEDVPDKSTVNRSAFIAYRFNDIAENFALKLTRFLELLSFDVKTGRTYSPKKVSEKVEERVAKQSIFFVILTEGDDDTWLNQEPMIAKSQNKPIFILKDSDYKYSSGIFADQEFIPFQKANIEKCFLQVLEGLRELNLLSFKYD